MTIISEGVAKNYLQKILNTMTCFGSKDDMKWNFLSHKDNEKNVINLSGL